MRSLFRNAPSGFVRDNSYSWAPCTNGSAAHVFVIDTGIYAEHVEFGTRVSATATCVLGSSCFAGTPSWGDDYGHGTHCSGTAGGVNTGVHKSVVLHAVKVLSSSGSGSTSGVAAGVNWVAQTVANDPTLRPAVVTMSLGGPASTVLDNAISALVAGGIPAVVAAGNDGLDACRYSPARVPTAITVAAVDASGTPASWSNSGTCVDVYAPGVGIYSALNSAGAYATWSGTSMATPHVTGIVALMLAAAPCLTPAQISDIIASTATPTVVGAPRLTTNRFVNSRAAVAAAAGISCAQG